MAKGFGSPRQGHLGYVLLLLPTVKAYAADFSLGETDEEFMGLTSSLELAQVWKKKSAARQAVVNYLDFLIEQLEDAEEVEISIHSLKRLSNGQLKTEPEEDLIFAPTRQPST